MNRNVTASFSLSVSLVLLFAVLLYQPDGPVSKPLQATSVAQAEPRKPISDLTEGRPPLTPGSPLTESSAGDGESDAPTPTPVARVEATEPAAVELKSGPSRGERSRETRPAMGTPRPTSAFTHARPGESLADIAIRVYGSPDSAGKIWMANRDLIVSPDAVPPGGTLLRTP
jgi:nucleoid-associated protein YgaU